jgi:uncharacterized coiled-coil DUF342 family protein
MNLLKGLLVVFLLGFTIAMSAQVVKTEVYVRLWENRVESLEHHEELAANIQFAQQYGQEVLAVARQLATENGLMAERDHKMTLYVAALEEESNRQKASLCEAVEKIQSLMKENNELHDEVFNLSYKVRCLEQALEAVSEPKAEAPPTNLFQDTINIIQYVDDAVAILTIIL